MLQKPYMAFSNLVTPKAGAKHDKIIFLWMPLIENDKSWA
jgi:hypothetical protein